MGARTPKFRGRTGLEPPASRVERPRAKPLGNPTTVGHSAAEEVEKLERPRTGQDLPAGAGISATEEQVFWHMTELSA